MAKLAENPKGSTVRTDEQGSYVAYHRICNNCQVELTSRNRAPCGSLKCMTCVNANSRDRWRETNGWTEKPPKPEKPLKPPSVPALETRKTGLGAVSPAERHLESHHTVSPERQAMHALLTKFLLHPLIGEYKANLLSALVTFEIRSRMSHL